MEDKIEIRCPCCKTDIWISKEVIEKENYIQCYICGVILKNKLK
jgi:uncharacterized Zn finger protein